MDTQVSKRRKQQKRQVRKQPWKQRIPTLSPGRERLTNTIKISVNYLLLGVDKRTPAETRVGKLMQDSRCLIPAVTEPQDKGNDADFDSERYDDRCGKL